MQVFVLGMHRSGTSAVARVLNLMGLYFGGEEVGIGRSAENKKGFWERRDVRALNDAILFEAGCDWDCLSALDLDALPEHKRGRYTALAGDIVLKLDAHRPWFVKEPRLSALFPIWRAALETPICVHVFRNPLDVASSLQERNGAPLPVGLALWEAYNVRALRGTADVPRLCTSFESLLRRPAESTRALHTTLQTLGDYPLRLPAEAELARFLDPLMHRQQHTEEELRGVASAGQLAVYDLLRDAAASASDALLVEVPALSAESRRVLAEYEATVDLGLRKTDAEVGTARRSDLGFALQVALKNLDLSHANARINEAQESSRRLERKTEELRATVSGYQAELAQANETARDLERQRNALADRNAEMRAAVRKAAAADEARRARTLVAVRRSDVELGLRQSKVAELSQFAGLLETHLLALLASKRWRIGNALVSLATLSLGRRNALHELLGRANQAQQSRREAIRTMAEKLADMPAAVASWGVPESAPAAVGGTAKRDADILRMQTERRLKASQRLAEGTALARHVAALVEIGETLRRSKRWRVGNGILALPKRMVLRAPPRTAVDSLAELLEQHRAGEFDLDRHDALLEEQRLAQAEADFGSAKPLYQANDLWRRAQVDVVVCVHNALADVERCLKSVLSRTTVDFRLIVVNDGSDQPTTTRLRELTGRHAEMEVLETNGPLGYTCAANRGLRHSSADYVVLLNSDTVVPRLWLEGMLDAMASGENVGLVGPLSNAASWQSVPERSDADSWKVNELPAGYNVDDFAELVHALSSRRFPRVAFLNGFCLMLRRRVIERVGLLDAAAFPQGYGEEDDYCLRVRGAGFELAVADHCYVYHAKSKSFGGRREQLAQAGGEALVAKHGSAAIAAGTEQVKNNADLARIRKSIDDFLHREETPGREPPPGETEDLPSRKPSAKTCDVLFLLPVKGASGGANSVIQEAAGMRRLGVDARVAAPAKHADSFKRFYRRLFDAGDVFVFYESEEELYAKAQHFDVIVATLWSTPALIAPFALRHPQKLYVYYVQDYEPWFFPNDPASEAVARDSYTLVPNMALMAKTDWICRTILEKHGRPVHRVVASLDHSLFRPRPSGEGDDGTVTVAAMVRPSTGRRAPLRTLRVLKAVTKTARADVRVVIFGCDPVDLESYIAQNHAALGGDFPYENRGVVPREEVAAVLQGADIFADLSYYQAFGRTGLEAMACGCAVMLPAEGGTSEFAAHGDNALVVDTSSFETVVVELTKLIDDAALRRRLVRQGIATARQYSVIRASLSELSVFRLAWSLGFTGRKLDAPAFRRGVAPFGAACLDEGGTEQALPAA